MRGAGPGSLSPPLAPSTAYPWRQVPLSSDPLSQGVLGGEVSWARGWTEDTGSI